MSYILDSPSLVGHLHFYPTLKKLEQDGLIVRQTVSQESRPNKHLYSITDEGRKQFHRYLESPVEEDVIRSAICVRLFFGEFADPTAVKRWIDEALLQQKATLAKLDAALQRYESEMNRPQRLNVEIGLQHTHAHIHTLEAGLRKLGTREMEES